MPFAKLPEFRTREGTALFSCLFLKVSDKTNTHVLWFFIRKIEKKFFCFCVNKFYDIIRIQKKKILTNQKNVFWTFEK